MLYLSLIFLSSCFRLLKELDPDLRGRGKGIQDKEQNKQLQSIGDQLAPKGKHSRVPLTKS